MIYARIFAHLFIAPIFGFLYNDVGNDATHTFGNYVYLYGSILLIVYTGKMSVVLSCELHILRKTRIELWFCIMTEFLKISSSSGNGNSKA